MPTSLSAGADLPAGVRGARAGRRELLTYATGRFLVWRRLLVRSARRFGAFDQIHEYSRSSVPDDYQAAHAASFAVPHGGGYWLWKPYLILRRLQEMRDGDLLFYVDSGAYFIDDPRPVLDLAASCGSPVLALGYGWRERDYTKRRALRYVGLDRPEILDTPQVVSSYMIFRAGAGSRAFAAEWLRLCEQPELLHDKPYDGDDAHPGFLAHRHDQSLFSLLVKRDRIPALPDPSIFDPLSGSRGPLFHHHRSQGMPLRYKLPAALLHRWSRFRAR